MHRHSLVQSSITLSIRNFRPFPKLSVIKSSDQRCACCAIVSSTA